ncbi:MAG: hypothetical protein FWC89_08340 [Defluviitaleaceae bacterium]|nr:hypothetical protein [Defluviitaleaceae bacterium]
MAYIRQVPRTGFFQELSKEMQEKYFSVVRDKVLPTIDNLYYSVFIRGDGRDLDIMDSIQPLVEGLDITKQAANINHEPVEFSHGLCVTLKSYKFYAYCLTQTDLYDIFLCYTLPNVETPRIVIQLRALGLWTRGVDNILMESYLKVEELLSAYNLKIEKCRESRIDYCYHINGITSPDKIFKEVGGKMKNLHTNLKDFYLHGDIEHAKDGTIVHKDYICMGSKKSNNVRARVYDKVKEVIEMGYKAFFFDIWAEKGLISYYDKWCMEYAFPYKNVDYLAKARIAFYVEHASPSTRREEYEKLLNNPNASLADFRTQANEFMPKTTPVLNIEYETKRKFYYYSDKFIETCKIDWSRESVLPEPLKRIYRIVDNKSLYLDYLTKKTLSFYKGKDANGEPKYLAWWERLRNVKLEGLKLNEKMLRDYTHHMDKQAVQKRAINAVASAAVYDDKLESGFVEDMSDFLADISDNNAHKMGLFFTDENGNIVKNVFGELLNMYSVQKAKKEVLLKNRKKKRGENDDNRG